LTCHLRNQPDLDKPGIRFEYGLAINLKTAKVLGPGIPSTLRARPRGDQAFTADAPTVYASAQGPPDAYNSENPKPGREHEARSIHPGSQGRSFQRPDKAGRPGQPRATRAFLAFCAYAVARSLDTPTDGSALICCSLAPAAGDRMRFRQLERREFITLLGGAAAAWPLATRAQQPALPLVGFLSSGSPRAFAKFLSAFQQGLSEAGFIEGRNVSMIYRWAEGHFDELDSLAAQLVATPVELVAATGGLPSARAAKKATSTIPIVTVLGFDPVKVGLVESFNRPGGNLTGTSIIASELGPKRLSLLYDLDPGIQKVAIVVNPGSTSSDLEPENIVDAAKRAGRPFAVLKAGSEKELEAVFASAAQQGIHALLISADSLFMARRNTLVALADSNKLPVMYPFREFVDAGGLMSYGPSLVSAYRVAGGYAGRILKGTRPSELPIEAPTAFEFVINMKAARRFGFVIPPGLLAIVDETIE